MEKSVSFNDSINISSQNRVLSGKLLIPEESQAIILFVDEHGKATQDKRFLKIAERFQNYGFATLFVDLLTADEADSPAEAMDIYKQAERITDIRNWAGENPQTEHLSIGLLSYGSGTAAALEAVVNVENKINALVSLGGRPDLAFDALKKIDIPLLFICGDIDNANVVQHEKSLPHFNTSSKMEVIRDAGKGFETESALEKVIGLSKEWFIRHL